MVIWFMIRGDVSKPRILIQQRISYYYYRTVLLLFTNLSGKSLKIKILYFMIH